jgi:hypothetical protein
MQGARYESGLDNSPMYDGEFFDANIKIHGSYGIGQMTLYDVGMASMFVSEADALTTLATLIGRTDEATVLKTRADAQRALIAKHMWDEKVRHTCTAQLSSIISRAMQLPTPLLVLSFHCAVILGGDLHQPLLERILPPPHLAHLFLRHDGQSGDRRTGYSNDGELAALPRPLLHRTQRRLRRS